MRKLLLLLAGVGVAAFAPICTAGAGIITINFPADLVGVTPGINAHNVTADGFRISPSCHFDLGVNGAPGIGWDSSACSVLPNPEYLGPPVPFGAGLYVDDSGQPFSLISAFVLGAPLFAESSSGGSVAIPPGAFGAEFDFTGPQWSDIAWVLFYYLDPGAPAAGFNQLVVSVSEPSSLAIFALSVAMFGFWRKRRG